MQMKDNCFQSRHDYFVRTLAKLVAMCGLRFRTEDKSAYGAVSVRRSTNGLPGYVPDIVFIDLRAGGQPDFGEVKFVGYTQTNANRAVRQPERCQSAVEIRAASVPAEITRKVQAMDDTAGVPRGEVGPAMTFHRGVRIIPLSRWSQDHVGRLLPRWPLSSRSSQPRRRNWYPTCACSMEGRFTPRSNGQ